MAGPPRMMAASPLSEHRELSDFALRHGMHLECRRRALVWLYCRPITRVSDVHIWQCHHAHKLE